MKKGSYWISLFQKIDGRSICQCDLHVRDEDTVAENRRSTDYLGYTAWLLPSLPLRRTQRPSRQNLAQKPPRVARVARRDVLQRALRPHRAAVTTETLMARRL